MRTRFYRRPASFCGELPPSRDLSRDHPRDHQRQALTRGAVLARFLQIFSARVERLTISVENSEYEISAVTLSAAILREHLSSGPV
jgi:hypothetical protein